MDNENELVYTSLQEATKYCPYSQEYLSLRARQGKLRALKFGRNWVTKKEWLEEYLKKVEEYNNFGIRKFVAPPENLPVETPIFKPVPVIRFGFIVVLVFVLLIGGIFYGRESFKIIYEDTTPLVIEFNENFNTGVLKLPENISSYVTLVGGAGDIIVGTPTEIIIDTVSTIPQSFQFVFNEINSQSVRAGYQIAGLGEISSQTFKEYGQWLLTNVKSQISKIEVGYFTINDSIERKINELVRKAVKK